MGEDWWKGPTLGAVYTRPENADARSPSLATAWALGAEWPRAGENSPSRIAAQASTFVPTALSLGTTGSSAMMRMMSEKVVFGLVALLHFAAIVEIFILKW